MEVIIDFLNELASKGVKLSTEAGQLNCYAQKGILTADLKDGILKYKSEIITLLDRREEKPQASADNVSLRQSKEFPLSAGQKGLYILQKLHPAMVAYNVPACFKINNQIYTAMMGEAWGNVLEQFPILIARVVERDGVLFHHLSEDCRTTIQQRVVDCSDEQFKALLQKQVKQPFDL